jgi:hypothetical protein
VRAPASSSRTPFSCPLRKRPPRPAAPTLCGERRGGCASRESSYDVAWCDLVPGRGERK